MITSFIPVFQERLDKLKNTLKNELQRAKSERRKDVMKTLVKDAKKLQKTIKEVKKMDTDFLLGKIMSAMNYETTVFYIGTLKLEEVKNSIKEELILDNQLEKSSSPVVYEQQLNNKNTIYLFILEIINQASNITEIPITASLVIMDINSPMFRITDLT